MLGNRRGIRVQRADERYIENDQILLVISERLSINVHDLGDATEAGPMIGLLSA